MRIYNSRLEAQFTQPDPIGLAGGLNLYGYANGDPVNFSDTYGLMADPATDFVFWLLRAKGRNLMRNSRQGSPISLSEAEGLGTERTGARSRAFHAVGAPGNRIFEMSNGAEWVFNGETPVTSGPNMGTFNYCPSSDPCHVTEDILPFLLFGTDGPGDTSTLGSRAFTLVFGGMPARGPRSMQEPDSGGS